MQYENQAVLDCCWAITANAGISHDAIPFIYREIEKLIEEQIRESRKIVAPPGHFPDLPAPDGDLCPLCKSKLSYCPQGCYCSSTSCRYAT